MLLSYSLQAQSGQYKIRQITTKDGLLTPGVKSTYKDSEGFIWFAFSNGMARYDGYTVRRFEDFLPDSCAITPYRFCTSFLEDSRGNFWIGTLKNGLVRFDRRTEKFTYYHVDPYGQAGLKYNTVYSLMEDSDRNLWLGSGNEGLFKYIPESDSFANFNPLTVCDNPGVVVVLSMLEDKQDNFWVGTAYALFLFDRENETFTQVPVPVEPGTPDELKQIWHIKEDKSGDIWLGTDWGVYRYKPHEKIWTYYFTGIPGKLNDFLGGNVNGLVEIETGKAHQMWIGTGSGLLVYDFATDHLEHFKTQEEDPQSPVSGGIKYLYRDDNNLIWASTGGMTIIDPDDNPFQYKSIHTYPDSLLEVDAWSFCEDKNGMLWVGTFNDGLYQFDRNLDFVGNYKPTVWGRNNPHIISKNRVTLIYEDTTGNLWVGTSGEGLSVFDRVRKRFSTIFFEKPSGKLERQWVFDIVEDTYGLLWFATQKGLFKVEMPWQKGQVLWPVDHPVLSDVPVIDLFEDSRGRLWATTYNLGVFCLTPENREKGEFKKYFHKSYNRGTFTERNVREVYEDVNGLIWMRSINALFQYNEASDSIEIVEHFSKIHKGGNHVIMGDSAGNLWFISDMGLIRYDLEDSTDRALKVFGKSEGMFYDGIVFTSFGKSKKGCFYIGGSGSAGSGFCRFYPDSIVGDNIHIPNIVLTDFKLKNETASLDSSITYKKYIELKYDQNFFSFGFAALDYTDPEKNQYAYYLEGFEDKWNYVNNRRLANYTGVPPGNYVFRVKGSNNDGYWNEVGASIAVTVLPPPWKTWWAYILYVLFLMALISTVTRFYLRRQRLLLELDMKQRQAEKLAELDKMKSEFFANISHEFRTPLTLILGPLEQLISRLYDKSDKEKLTTIQRNAVRLKNLISQLLNLSRLEAGKMRLQASRTNIIQMIRLYIQSFESLARQNEINLKFLTDRDELLVYVDRNKMEQVINNLISNAFKFTDRGGDITVYINYPVVNDEGKECVSIKITDNGRGIPEEHQKHIFDRFYQVDDPGLYMNEGTGIGLAICKELVELHHGTIEVQSKPGEFTAFNILLPAGKGHLAAGELAVEEEIISKTGDQELFYTTERVDHPAQPDFEGECESDEDAEHITDLPVLLIVEDNAEMRAYIRGFFDHNFHIVEASDGKEGVEEATDVIPDIIISDVMMPGMDGIEFCKKVKTDERTSHIPVILLTARASIESRIEGLETGADDFITKPFDGKELQVRVKNLIEQRKRLRGLLSKRIGENILSGQVDVGDSGMTSMDERFLQKLLKTVALHYSSPELTVETLGKETGLSRTQLHRKVTALTGYTAGKFIRIYRLNRAAEMIRKKSGTVAEIAYDVGFGSPSYFAECFRKQFGKLPSEY